MRSISWKLLLAFVLVSVSGTVLFFVIARNYSNQEIQNFLFDQDQTQIITVLETHYAEFQSWENIRVFWQQWQPINRPEGRGSPFALIDANGVVVLGFPGPGELKTGNQLSQEDLERAIPIELEGEIIGYLFFLPENPREYFDEHPVLNRINELLIFSAFGSVVLALVLGLVLSRTMSRPLKELSSAARRAATGDLSQKVEIKSKDEIGLLANSFNQMMEDLERLMASRRQMTADIAHDLRTPISVILGHSEAVHDGVIEPSQETFEIVRDEALRLERLVKDLKDLSMADIGELSLELKPVSPGGILDQLEKSSLPLMVSKDISLQKDVAEDLPAVMVDEDRILQVVHNIMDNAIRHTPQGGRISVAARVDETGHFVQFEVLDGGPGVQPDELEKIFNRFYRTDPSRQRDREGSGLGLAIARSITEQHGGKIWAESARGSGLSIKFNLPIAENPNP
jgi:two-component system sensor histidine kinase BaeS